MQWVTVASACWVRFQTVAFGCEGQTRLMAWEEVELQGEDSQPLPGTLTPPSLPSPLSPSPLSLLLPVSHPWQRSLTKSSWWRETLSTATKRVLHTHTTTINTTTTTTTSPPLPHSFLTLYVCWTWCSLHTHTHSLTKKDRSLREEQRDAMPNVWCRLEDSEPTQCFPTTGWMTESVACKPCKCCKTADFLDTRRGCYDSLHKH